MKTFDARNYQTDTKIGIRDLQNGLRAWCDRNDISSDEEYIYQWSNDNTSNYTTTLYQQLQELKEACNEA